MSRCDSCTVRHCNGCEYDKNKDVPLENIRVHFPEHEPGLMEALVKQWAEQMAIETDRAILNSLIKQMRKIK